MKIYLDTRERYKKIVKWLDGQMAKDEIETSGDILAAIQALLTRNHLTISQIDQFVIHPGPGSFTGLRVGAAIANAFNFSKGFPIEEAIVPQYGEEPKITQLKSKNAK